MKNEYAEKLTPIFRAHHVEVFKIDVDEIRDEFTIWVKPVAPPKLRAALLKVIGPRWATKFEELPDDWNKTHTYESVGEVQSILDVLKEKKAPMTKQEYMDFHRECCARMIEITVKKNSDYTGDSGDPFANFQQIGSLVQAPNVVEIGFLTRMSDKLSRLGSFVTKGSLLVKDESVEDTLIDLANYCILFAGFLRSKRNQS